MKNKKSDERKLKFLTRISLLFKTFFFKIEKFNERRNLNIDFIARKGEKRYYIFYTDVINLNMIKKDFKETIAFSENKNINYIVVARKIDDLKILMKYVVYREAIGLRNVDSNFRILDYRDVADIQCELFSNYKHVS